MLQINWGIIGCGDVTEIKSGPAFNKVPHSKLIAVMRRDAAKAEYYAKRHGVSKWYRNAETLINDPEINAVYIATPPSSHYQYAAAVLKAGKFVYVEKPMTLDVAAALALEKLVQKSNGKFSVAHYRRAHPHFIKIKALIDEGYIGEIKFINLQFLRKNITTESLKITKNAWRVDPSISGGGLFHDMAPHQLDMLFYIFGEIEVANGIAASGNKLYAAADTVSGSILFKNGVLFNGCWCFDIGNNEEVDYCEIIGAEGKIKFSFFDKQEISIIKNGKEELIRFEKILHVQQPMIERVVDYFLGKGDNPCDVSEGVEVMKLIDCFTKLEALNSM